MYLKTLKYITWHYYLALSLENGSVLRYMNCTWGKIFSREFQAQNSYLFTPFTLNPNRCNKGSQAPNTFCWCDWKIFRWMIGLGLVVFIHLHCFFIFQPIDEPGDAAGPTLSNCRCYYPICLVRDRRELQVISRPTPTWLPCGAHYWFHSPHWESMIMGQSSIQHLINWCIVVAVADLRNEFRRLTSQYSRCPITASWNHNLHAALQAGWHVQCLRFPNSLAKPLTPTSPVCPSEMDFFQKRMIFALLFFAFIVNGLSLLNRGGEYSPIHFEAGSHKSSS